MTGEELVERAEAAASAPTRRTRTTSSVLSSGPATARVFEGVNVENAAYPLGICAERLR